MVYLDANLAFFTVRVRRSVNSVMNRSAEFLRVFVTSGLIAATRVNGFIGP